MRLFDRLRRNGRPTPAQLAALPAQLFSGRDVERLLVDRDVDSLADSLRRGDAQVRRAAARGLGVLGEANAVEPLSAALSDRNRAVVREVVRSLGLIREPRAVEALTWTAERRSDLTGEVSAALGAIGGAEAEAAPRMQPYSVY